MSSDVAISVNKVNKTYYLYDKPIKRLFRRGRKSSFQALQDVSLTVERGKTVGIIGRNGSGKSTLLQIVTGILQPTEGTVQVNGRIAALLELGAGFNMEFTGRENVYLNAAVMGISREKIDRRFPEIVDFADIGEFINYPVKTYSSGMFVRLAFAVAIMVDPEIMIIDEALSVGDAAFQHKCFARLKDLQKKGTSILFVSHDTDSIKSFCQEVVLLDHGRLLYAGDPETAVNKYYELLHLDQIKKVAELPASPGQVFEAGPGKGQENFNTANRHGTGEARFISIDLLDKHGLSVENIVFGDRLTVRLGLIFEQPIGETNIGVLWRDSSGIDVLGNDSLNLGQAIPPQQPGTLIYVEFTVDSFCLKQGSYALTVAIGRVQADGLWNSAYYDWVNNAKIIQVGMAKGIRVWTKVLLPMSINIYSNSEEGGVK